MARRKFAKLKALMFEREVTQADIATVSGRSQTYVASRMTGRMPFDLDDVQIIGKYLEIPPEKWLDYFLDTPA